MSQIDRTESDIDKLIDNIIYLAVKKYRNGDIVTIRWSLLKKTTNIRIVAQVDYYPSPEQNGSNVRFVLGGDHSDAWINIHGSSTYDRLIEKCKSNMISFPDIRGRDSFYYGNETMHIPVEHVQILARQQDEERKAFKELLDTKRHDVVVKMAKAISSSIRYFCLSSDGLYAESGEYLTPLVLFKDFGLEPLNKLSQLSALTEDIATYLKELDNYEYEVLESYYHFTGLTYTIVKKDRPEPSPQLSKWE